MRLFRTKSSMTKLWVSQLDEVFEREKKKRLISEGIIWNISGVTEGSPAGCTTWKAIAAAAANQAVWGLGDRAGCEQWDSSNEVASSASPGQLTGGIRDQRASDALKGLEDKMYYCAYFTCCAGSRELSASICSSHWKEERCSHTSVLIRNFFCAGREVKITRYSCNIKRHKEKITLGKKGQLLLVSCLEDSLLEATGCRAWMQRIGQSLYLWLPKSNSSTPGTCPSPHLPHPMGQHVLGLSFLIMAAFLEPRCSSLINLDGPEEREFSFFPTAPDPAAKTLQS